MKVDAFAAIEPGGGVLPYDFEKKQLLSNEVRIRISHCGVCRSDIHLLDNDWGFTSYPFVPGHEIVGEICELGSAVTALKLEDRVGLGWQCGSCGKCDYCSEGDEQFCSKSAATCVHRFGGYAREVICDQRFALRIPDNLASPEVAPLMCGGITVYSPLDYHGVGKGARLAVVGIGGLGHLAIQFASRLGANVTAISSSPTKESEAREFGAERFVSLGDRDRLTRLANAFDFILTTASVDLDWMLLVGMLRPRGKLILLGVPTEPLVLPASLLISGQKTVSGSAIGSPRTIAKMLQFAADHGVRAKIEQFAMSEVNSAISKVRNNAVRYRAVLHN